MNRFNQLFAGLLGATGGFLVRAAAKGILIVNVPHPMPRGAVSGADRMQSSARRKPYTSIFGVG